MVIDTNIFIEYLRKLDKSKTSLAQLPPTTVLHVSSITVFELYVGQTRLKELKWQKASCKM